MYYQHPAFISLFAAILLSVFRKNKAIFQAIVTTYPIIIIFYLTRLVGNYKIDFFNFTLSSNFDQSSWIVGSAIAVALTFASLYSTILNNRMEAILGAILGGFAFLVLLADDFISIIIGIEMMMLVSTLYIAIGTNKNSFRSAKRYFLLHLTSGNMIVAGVAYIITKNNYNEIIPLSLLINNDLYSNIVIFTILAGSLINIAAFPFSFWMTNYYPDSSSSAFVYLIVIPTKISIILIMKLFPALEFLKIAGIGMILYSGIRAVFEDHLKRLLCHLSIISMGILLIGIGIKSPSLDLEKAILCYVALHILYKSLLAIIVSQLEHKYKISLCSDLKTLRLKSGFIIFAALTVVAVMTNLPYSNIFYSKKIILGFLHDDIVSRYFVQIALILIILALPVRAILSVKYSSLSLFSAKEKFTGYLVLALSSILFVAAFLAQKILNHDAISFYGNIRQILLIIAALAASYFMPIRRFSSLDFDLLKITHKMSIYLYIFARNMQSQSLVKEPWIIKNMERRFIKKLALIKDQQTAIFTVFLFFLVMIWYFVDNI